MLSKMLSSALLALPFLFTLSASKPAGVFITGGGQYVVADTSSLPLSPQELKIHLLQKRADLRIFLIMLHVDPVA